MIHRKPKTIPLFIKNIVHHPKRIIVRWIVWIVVLYTVYVWFFNALDEVVVRQRLLPWYLLITAGILTTKFPKIKPLKFHWIAFFEDFGEKSLARSFSILNRVGIFPIVLTLYLLYLVLDQTQFMNLHLHPVFLALDEQFLVIVVLISWIWLITYEAAEKEYQYKWDSWSQMYQMVWLSMVLSLVAGFIIAQQVNELWWIGIIIANTAMVLVFLVGIMLMNEK